MPSRIILPPKVIALLKAEGATEVETGDETRSSGITTPHLSYSQMSMYLRCSMQYFFRYVQGLKDRPKVSLAIGLGGHAALEKNTKRKLNTGSDAPLEQVMDWASDFMDLELSRLPPSEIEKDVEPGETKDKFIAATRVFRVRDAPAIKPIGAEIEFSLDLNPYQPTQLEEPIRIIKGKIDLISEDSATMVTPYKDVMKVAVDDFKFVARKRSQNEVNLSPQLTLYAGVMHNLTG
jgi:ATP-dependent helicase/DNAse subunit B